MFNTRINNFLFLSCIFLFLICSCGNKFETIYTGNSNSVLKLQSILSLYKIPSKVFVDNNEIKVQVSNFNKAKADNIVLAISEYLNIHSEFDIKSVFIPKNNEIESNLEKLLGEIKYVLSVSNNDLGKSFIVALPDHEQAKELVVAEVNKYLKETPEFKVSYRYIQVPNTLELDMRESRLGLTLLEPFSFHVPEQEKSLAGIQLMSILILFLFSGFVLGLCWGRLRK